MFDGYDSAVRFADEQVGRVLDALSRLGVLDDTAVIITADHGESLGELNVYGNHCTADETVLHVPLIVSWPGVTDGQGGRVDAALRYQFDWSATMLELLGQSVPEDWDGRSFAGALRNAAEDDVRRELVMGMGMWTCQRAVRFSDEAGRWLYIHTDDDGCRGLDEAMLFQLDDDPHEQTNLASQHPARVAHAQQRLSAWLGDALARTSNGVDPMRAVRDAGLPGLTPQRVASYLQRLRATGRGEWADRLEQNRGPDRSL
jgi:arylsulfatase A-like enzyme